MSIDTRQSAVRRQFLDFFVARGHREVPSGPVFPQDDPTLLFTNAGMNQFKDVFLGTGTRPYRRAVDTQKCIRVSGKHNDLEEVGRDTYHHTFFEMLGNWSFGDYFKAEAIPWAWELLTGVWKLPKERLWVTVFGGDQADGLPADEDAERIWREATDVDPSHVLRFGRKDNFWEMGDTGPCGPCSEIHIDRGGPGTDPRDGADRARGVNAGNERFMELWNLVFMEFNRVEGGALKPLPARHVDTGMGFERIVSVLQGKRSNYDTDVFTPIFRRVEELVGRPYGGGTGEADVAFRVIADHVRAVASAFADGALPSNLGRGYVLRRLIRRASRYGRQALGMEEPFLWQVVPAVAETLGEVFPEIPRRAEHVELLLRTEEESFGKTLGRGIVRFEDLARRTGRTGGALSGREAFDLYATYGFPKDLVELMAREHGLALDDAGWSEAEREHQAASRSEGRFRQLLSTEDLGAIERVVKAHRWEARTESTYHGEGERSWRLETDTIHLRAGDDEGRRALLVLRESPFYPEGGGQIGDTGTIEHVGGLFRMLVEDAQRFGDFLVHVGTWEGPLPEESVRVVATVDRGRRDRTRKNHTATHLVHKALKLVLGEHVAQQGSYVGPDRLRFDFSHPRAVAPEELEEVERLVNERVIENAPVCTTIEELAAAKGRGVVAMFGEKYGETVRVLDVGGWSLELCGGTHVAAAGDIGPFVIVGEGAIQAGVRRIEALTGPEAVRWIQEQRRLLREAARALKSPPEELPGRIEQLQAQVKEARKQAGASAKADVDQAFAAARSALVEREGLRVGALAVDLPTKALRELATRVKALAPDLVVLLFGREGERVPWIAISQGAARERGLDATRAAALLREHLGGGGGGKPELAQGQGERPEGLAAVLGAVGDAPERAFGG